MSVIETATQNVWHHQFPEPCKGGGLCGTNWPTEVVVITTLCEFDENAWDSSLPSLAHIWITLSDFFCTLTLKSTQRTAFKKNA
jgi:hypothetical protein